MDAIKQYWPWILGALVVLYALTRMRSRTILAPQTAFSETAQPDPFAAFRAAAFEQLVGLGIASTEAEAESERARIARDVAFRQQDVQVRGFGVELERIGAAERAASRLANLDFLRRENDREAQSRAIDRVYSSRSTAGDIIGSVAGALNSIFRPQGGGGVFTPPTFPRFGGGLF